jgi:hypothetical protein
MRVYANESNWVWMYSKDKQLYLDIEPNRKGITKKKELSVLLSSLTDWKQSSVGKFVEED